MSDRPALHEDLRASDMREWQLWLLTLGLLLCVGAAAIVSGFVLVDAYLVDGAARQLAFRMLAGLALLILLFAGYVLQARIDVGSVKVFLNEMSGMAAGNLEVKDCLAALARGMARIYHSPVSRILIQRTPDSALELVANYTVECGGSESQGPSYDLEDLPLFRRVLESNRPVILDLNDLGPDAASSLERSVLTGGLPTVSRALLLPLQTSHGGTGLIVVGLRRRIETPRPKRRLIATAAILARHAGTVIDEAIRRSEAVRDPLTDLYNRRHFARRAREEIDRAAREQHPLAILLCDLDGFKQVNDSRGHPFGDLVLKAVATTLRHATRGTDLHFRWGGDEMVVILSKSSEEGALIAAERIRAGIRLHAKHVGIELDASIGIAIYPSHGTSEEELIRVADLAMYVAKNSGDKMRIGFEEYTVTEQCVTLVYQPIWHVDSRTVVGYEVFSRDPRGDLSPAGLFQKYRAAGQLRRLKRLIFARQIREARQAGIGRVFLNVDLEFLRGTEPPLIPQGLEAVVELSELDSSSPAEQRLAVALKWRQAGYRIALDDFGAGYASLSVLAELRPDYIKVDRSCIARATESEQYREFLRHLVQSAAVMASGGVIAEGIEQVSELEVVGALGIPLAQGFLLGRPTPAPATGVACEWPETSHASIDS